MGNIFWHLVLSAIKLCNSSFITMPGRKSLSDKFKFTSAKRSLIARDRRVAFAVYKSQSFGSAMQFVQIAFARRYYFRCAAFPRILGMSCVPSKACRM